MNIFKKIPILEKSQALKTTGFGLIFMSNLENGMHVYTGWFHFKGSFEGPDYLDKLSKENTDENKEFNVKEITKKFSIGFRNENFLTNFEDRTNLVQVEFECMIPWVLDLEFEPEEVMEG